jgi:broad specificity phosphatase PhoE
MPKRFLYLVRHAKFTSTAAPSDEPDGPLTAEGRQQAILTAQRLRGLPIVTIHHSTAQRALETAHLIAEQFPDVPLQPSPLLRECIAAIPPPSALPAKYRASILKLPRDFLRRGKTQAERAFDKYFRRPRNGDVHEIIVSHGNIIDYFACRVIKAPAWAWINLDIRQCGVSEVVIDSTGWMRLMSHNETGHLPENLRMFL